MEIWQTSNGQKVATVARPGVYARTDSFFYNNNQYMIVGQRGNFDIWDIATGKLLYKYHGSTPFSISGVDGSDVYWSPDGKYLTMIAGKDPGIGDGVVLAPLLSHTPDPLNKPVASLAFSIQWSNNLI